MMHTAAPNTSTGVEVQAGPSRRGALRFAIRVKCNVK